MLNVLHINNYMIYLRWFLALIQALRLSGFITNPTILNDLKNPNPNLGAEYSRNFPPGFFRVGIFPEISRSLSLISRSDFLPNPDPWIFYDFTGLLTIVQLTNVLLLSQISVVMEMDLWSWSRPTFWNFIFLKKAKGFFCIGASEPPLSPKQTSQNQKCHFFKGLFWFYSI